eukprot:gene6143-8470_t
MSKKVKGTKMDLSTFVGDANDKLSLPTAPADPSTRPERRYGDRGDRGNRDGGGFNRDREGGGRGYNRDGGGSGGGGYNRNEGGNNFRDRDGGRFDRNDRNDDRESGGGGWGRNDRRRDPVDESNNDNGDGEAWQKVSSNSGYRSRGGKENFVAEERPDHLKLKLTSTKAPEPTTSNTPSTITTADNTTQSTVKEDKWDKLFKNSTSTSESRPYGNDRGSGGGGFRDRDGGGGGGSFRDRDGGGGGGFRDRDGGGGGGFRDRDGGGRRGGYDDHRGGGYENRGGRYEDRGDSRGGYQRGGGGGGYNRNRGDDEEITDSRFAGKFGGGGSSNYRRGGGESSEVVLPTAPRNALGSGPVNPPKPIIPAGPTPEEVKAAQEAKAKKIAEKEEEERKAKELKLAAQQAKEAEIEKKKNARMISIAAAIDLLATGLKGESLVAHVQALANDSNNNAIVPTGAAILRQILTLHSSENESTAIVDSKWWVKEEYGSVLSHLLVDGGSNSSLKAQIDALCEIQLFCHEKKFPKINVKGKDRKLIEVTFTLLLNNMLIDGEAFLIWAENDNGVEEGKSNALFQTDSFLTELRKLEENNEEYDEDDDEVDAPRTIIK